MRSDDVAPAEILPGIPNVTSTGFGGSPPAAEGAQNILGVAIVTDLGASSQAQPQAELTVDAGDTAVPAQQAIYDSGDEAITGTPLGGDGLGGGHIGGPGHPNAAGSPASPGTVTKSQGLPAFPAQPTDTEG